MDSTATDSPSMHDLTIAILIGTTRAQRHSHQVAYYIADYLQRFKDIRILVVDPLDFEFPGDGNDPEGKDPRYSKIVAEADAFFIVSPEYNHSFSGSLKRMLDSELAAYNHKPVAFAGVSSGGWGGVRGVEALVNAVRELGLVVLGWDLYFPRVQELFEADGKLKPAVITRYNTSLEKLCGELFDYARLFKELRSSRRL